MSRIIICLFLTLLTSISTSAQSKKYHFSESKMGSPFNIVLVSVDSLQAAQLAAKCYALVDSFNHIYSDYDTTSELSIVNRQAGLGNQQLSRALWDIIVQSQTAFQKSKGAFDISVGQLSLLWRKARKEKMFPSKKLVAGKKQLVGFKEILLFPGKEKISILKTGMRLDLGGIAKGYIAQKVIDLLRENGITQALADAGGDMVMSDAPPGAKGWTIGVNVPETKEELLAKKLILKNMAVATSGDAYQFIEHNGIKYSHIIDPRTGYGISSQRNVTIIAQTGADADWLATACSILSIPESKKLVASMHAELLITELKNGRIIYYTTKGFAKYWK